MKPKIYNLLRECIEDGASRGVMRAFKHTDTPDMDTIVEQVQQAVMNEIHEWFEFDDTKEQ